MKNFLLGHKNLGAAVAMLGGDSGFSAYGVHGLIRLTQIDENSCVVDGTIDGLAPGKHGLHVHECGDISNGCNRYFIFALFIIVEHSVTVKYLSSYYMNFHQLL